MKFLQLLSWILFATALGNAGVAQNKEAPFSIKGLSEREQTQFLQGIGQPVVVFDVMLQVQGKARLFCTPNNLSLDAKTVSSLANDVLAGPHEAKIVAIAVLDQLALKFPCEAESNEEAELEELNKRFERWRCSVARLNRKQTSAMQSACGRRHPPPFATVCVKG